MAKIKDRRKLPPNPYARKARIIARLSNDEMQIALEKQMLYFGNEKGAMSELVREAVLTYNGKKYKK